MYVSVYTPFMPTISTTEARANFAEIINRVQYAGDEFIIKKQGKPVVLITRAPKKSAKVKKNTGIEFLEALTHYHLKGGPKDLAKNHDKYTWE